MLGEEKAELGCTLIQNIKEALHGTYVLHGPRFRAEHAVAIVFAPTLTALTKKRMSTQLAVCRVTTCGGEYSLSKEPSYFSRFSFARRASTAFLTISVRCAGESFAA